MAKQLKVVEREPFDFSCTIMALEKLGVGKSTTINSMFDEVKIGIDAIQLDPSLVKRFIKKTPPHIVLYLDKLDIRSKDFGDMPLLHTIANIFCPSIRFNAIVIPTLRKHRLHSTVQMVLLQAMICLSFGVHMLSNKQFVELLEICDS
ncbi:unnamed protein product [Dovyalis caffra]|uniref:G domain-containing protein n=1 Tax=Dovyalis caffra TaxID=77055 RepID=A0AAV1RV72_9ROSI|nr:unnamed protein product [Dovyalis caffra]